MMDILPYVQQFLLTLPRGSRLTALDFGCGTGHGTDPLGGLYQSSMKLGYRLSVTGLDITGVYANHIRLTCRYMAHKVADIYQMPDDEQWDIVVSSHTIEHVEDPLAFWRRLQQLARHRVFVAAPFEEREEALTRGHINIFDDDFLQQLEPLLVAEGEERSLGCLRRPSIRNVRRGSRGCRVRRGARVRGLIDRS